MKAKRRIQLLREKLASQKAQTALVRQSAAAARRTGKVTMVLGTKQQEADKRKRLRLKSTLTNQRVLTVGGVIAGAVVLLAVAKKMRLPFIGGRK